MWGTLGVHSAFFHFLFFSLLIEMECLSTHAHIALLTDFRTQSVHDEGQIYTKEFVF